MTCFPTPLQFVYKCSYGASAMNTDEYKDMAFICTSAVTVRLRTSFMYSSNDQLDSLPVISSQGHQVCSRDEGHVD